MYFLVAGKRPVQSIFCSKQGHEQKMCRQIVEPDSAHSTNCGPRCQPTWCDKTQRAMTNFCQNSEPALQSVAGLCFADPPEFLTTTCCKVANHTAENARFIFVVNRVAVSVLHNFMCVGLPFRSAKYKTNYRQANRHLATAQARPTSTPTSCVR